MAKEVRDSRWGGGGVQLGSATVAKKFPEILDEETKAGGKNYATDRSV